MSSSYSGPQPSGPIFQTVERMRREFERWVDSALQQGNRALDAVGLRGTDRPWTPAVDLLETPSDVYVDVDLPGFEPGSVEVSLVGNMLTVKGPKPLGSLPDGSVAHLMERMHGPFERSIPMPAPVVADGVTAELKHGVLHLRLPKSERARPQKIAVRSEPATSRPADQPVRPL
jgi:HSP20 family protein